jgi:glycosyltransferase involved in cell wall biosynthesis
VEKNVRFLGECDNVPEILAVADLFVMPSYEENFGNVLLEAMMMGKPCIATNSGGTPDILEGGRCGLLVEPRSTGALQEGVLRLLEDGSLRSTLAERAAHRARTVYDLEVVTGRVESLLDGL